MGKDKSTNVEEKMALAEEVAVGVNMPLRAHTGVALVAMGCAACGIFLGYEHGKPASSCSGTAVDPHDTVPATRFDADTVRVDAKTKRMTAGRVIPAADDPDDLEAQAKALLERAAAARKVADKA